MLAEGGTEAHLTLWHEKGWVQPPIPMILPDLSIGDITDSLSADLFLIPQAPTQMLLKMLNLPWLPQGTSLSAT